MNRSKVVGWLYVLSISAMMLPISVEAQNKPGSKPGGQQGRGHRGADQAPEVGVDAPPFKLKMYNDTKREVELASFKNKKPVILIFGSYT